MIDQFPPTNTLPRMYQEPADTREDDPLAWQADALCAQTDPEAFFPEKGEPTKAAKRICAACPAAAQCLQYAIDNHITHGLWGGVAPKQRRHMDRSAA
ncbi:WhiB family transcriptional regulator [Leifsonia sp. F6_8S_P_1B]|uniref:Transcriptional regulator WhiB n=1 Tax=Leifsonia williamsii TaxID=3035919 RepID=A0ABT8KG48_9MICO|nr:WhiB family transcriptional regulator [Leifsonia williamsii]MDN4616440.1 WhiB family transcriptional regulator [Leifsonia williamsii]